MSHTHYQGALRPAGVAGEVTQVVCVGGLDPVESGLVKSLARPGGNATGLTNIHAELSNKLLELVTEAVPKVSRVAILWEPAHAGNDAIIKTLRAAAPALRVSLQSVEARHHTEIEPAFLAMKRQGVDAVIVLWSNMMGRVWIADLALKHRLPLASTAPVYTWEGGLLSYTDNQDAVLARAAAFIDKILKGAKKPSGSRFVTLSSSRRIR